MHVEKFGQSYKAHYCRLYRVKYLKTPRGCDVLITFTMLVVHTVGRY